MPSSRLRVPLIALVAVLVSIVTIGQPASADDAAADPSTWQVQPSGAEGPDDRAYFELEANPGAVLQDTVAVTNVSEHPLTLRVFGSDAYNVSTGEFDLQPSATPAVDVGSWITFAPDVLSGDGTVTIPARSRLILPFALAVPANATPGDHAGGIVASLATVRTSETGEQVLVDARVAARIYLAVGGALAPKLEVSDVHIDRAGEWWNPLGGEVTATWTVTNTGNIRLGGSGELSLSGPFGLGGMTAQATDLPDVLPGSSVTMSAKLHDVPALGMMPVTGSVQPVDDTGRVAGPIALVTFGATLWAVPWTVLAALLVIAALTWLIVRRARDRRAAVRALEEEIAALQADKTASTEAVAASQSRP